MTNTKCVNCALFCCQLGWPQDHERSVEKTWTDWLALISIFLFIFKILWRDKTFEPVLVNFALELYHFHQRISLLLFNCLIVILSFVKLNSIDLLFGLSSLPSITLLIASYPRLLFEVLKWIEAGRRAKYLHTVSFIVVAFIVTKEWGVNKIKPL